MAKLQVLVFFFVLTSIPSGFGDRWCGSVYCSEVCCGSSSCILKSQICDGINNCNDDELKCESCTTSGILIPDSVYEGCLEDQVITHMTSWLIRCKTGYYLPDFADSTNITCVNGVWSIGLVTCMPGCSKPLLNSNITLFKADKNSETLTPLLRQKHFHVADSVMLVCNDGYFTMEDRLTTHVLIACKGINTWEPDYRECIPEEHFIHVYKPQKEIVVEKEFNGSVNLSCIYDNPGTKMGDLVYVWLKDEAVVKPSSKDSLSLYSDGVLFITEVLKETVGTYTCLIKNNSQYIATGVVYKVENKTDCVPLPANTSMVVKENSSALVFCANGGSQSLYPSIWYDKNAIRIWNNDKYAIIGKRTLLINRVTVEDEGPIVCDMGPTSPFCENRFTTNLQVLPSDDDSICGQSASYGFPWLVSIWWNDETAPFCYGALVNHHWVITAASCLIGVHRKRNPDVFVRLEYNHESNFSGRVQNAHVIPVEYAKIHPKYSRRINFADIGVVKLKQNVIFTKNIHPICLSATDIAMKIRMAEVCESEVVLGNVSGSGSLEGELQLPSKELMEWRETLGDCSSMPEGVFCAKGKDSVSKNVADTGSPFEIIFDGKVYLSGIYSWGERRSEVGKFDYFVNVTTYYKWIVSHVNK